MKFPERRGKRGTVPSFRALALSLVLAVLVAHSATAEAAELSERDRALIKQAERYTKWPDESDLPVPPDGWYAIEVCGESIDIFRDGYGVPHIVAQTIEGAFRGQGYALMEDRLLQTLHSREAVMGRLQSVDGPASYQGDCDTRVRSRTVNERQAMADALSPRQRMCFDAYIEGANAYIERYVPYVPPVQMTEMVAGCVYHMAMVGDSGGDELRTYELLNILKFLRGEEFVAQFLHDCMPLDVPNAPTVDHSHRGTLAHTDPGEPPDLGYFDFEPVLDVLRREEQARQVRREHGQVTKWGSQAWVVAAQRSATGRAMLFGGPMMEFQIPCRGALVHLVAPGFNVIGMAFPGIPGVLVGHNERVAWTTTMGLWMNQTDLFREDTNPENPYQYKFKGEWRDMERFDCPMVVRQPDGTFKVQPFAFHRTVHGPVVSWKRVNRHVYSRATTHYGYQLQSFAAFLDMNFAEAVDDIGVAAHEISTAHNVFAADVDGNIGYWLTGRFPIQHPDQDPRLVTPGTGDREWLGIQNATELVSGVNPPEGWFASFNNKPSVKTPGWFPERLWGAQINDTLEQNNPIDWDTFMSINRRNGEQHLALPFMKPHLDRLLAEHCHGDPHLEEAARVVTQWSGKNITNSPGALLFDEYVLELFVDLLEQDLAPIVEPNMDRGTMVMFGPLVFRLIEPEASGIELMGDYLHGRDPDQVAFNSFKKVVARLTETHGPDIGTWPHDPPAMPMGHLPPFPMRTCGTYWMAADMDTPIRSVNMLCPGQSGMSTSPHYLDQLDLFWNWEFMDMTHLPEELPARAQPTP